MSVNTYQDGKEQTEFKLKPGGKLPNPGVAADFKTRGFEKVPTHKGKTPLSCGKKEVTLPRTVLSPKTKSAKDTSLEKSKKLLFPRPPMQ